MRSRFIGLTMLALTATAAHPASSYHSANTNLPGCKNLLLEEEKILSREQNFRTGRCAGILLGISYFASSLARICWPEGITNDQITRVVVSYIDRRPERWHEDFRDLALEAMRDAWPCKQQ
jgi:hypothetical protein